MKKSVVVICPELPGWTQRILWGPGCPESCVVDDCCSPVADNSDLKRVPLALLELSFCLTDQLAFDADVLLAFVGASNQALRGDDDPEKVAFGLIQAEVETFGRAVQPDRESHDRVPILQLADQYRSVLI